MRYKPLIEVETFEEFRQLKLAGDSTNITYITYDDQIQTYGEPDILWKQIVFVLDRGIIYTKGKIFIDNNELDTLSYNFTESQKDNAIAFIDLYDRMGILESTTASYYSNYLNNLKDYNFELVQSDWNESNPLSYAYILNKPTIPTIPTETKLSYELKGSGNAVTNISVNNHKITLDKGSYFLTNDNLSTYIKTINNQSIVGSGNLTLSGLPEVDSSYNGKSLMVVNGQWALISPSTFYSGSGVPNDINGNDGDIYIQIEE